ncbi:TonB-dependent receptor domain-containing protein [Phenylobacterium sp.]|uniref:TonB-dependent receptor domain-containing protein n=1 Tax=Phenylobacterium sp. TaxID=1871053 RepID=UPI00356A35EE
MRFHIEAKPYSEALLDLAQQANVTLVGAAACSGYSREALSASLTVEQALNRLLAGTNCAWKEIAPNTIQVSAAAPPAARPPAPPPSVSELLVTATKRVRDPRQLAVPITAVSGADLYPTGASDAAEGAARMSMLSTNLGPARDKLLLRGLSDGAYTGRARSTVATYLDDIPLNYNAPDPDLRLVDVQRVEIARGPQSALYGAGFLSGVYRIISNKPNLHEVSAEGAITAAVTDHGTPSGAIEGYVNLPIRSDLIGVRLAAYDQIDGGYLDNVRLGKDDVNRTERKGARLSVLFEPRDDWTVLMTAADQHLRSDDTQYTTAGSGLTRDTRIAEPHTNDITLWSAQVRRSWSWGELTSSTGVVEHAYGSLYDATASQNLFTTGALSSAYVEHTTTTMLVEDLYLTSRGTGRFQWLAGVYGSSTTEHSPSDFLAHLVTGTNKVAYSDNRHDRIDEGAAYGEASWTFAPDWTLAVGGRVFSILTHTRSLVESESENFRPRELDRSGRFNGFTPKISLQHTFVGGDLLYAVYSEGYRAGGFNSGGTTPLPEAQATYAPDRLRNYEIGLKLQAFDRRLSVNSAIYYDKWTDIQTDQYRESGLPYTTNAGDATVRGVETEIAYRADNGLSFELNGRYTETQTSNPNINFLSVLINGLPNAPPFSGGGLVSYERAVPGGWRLRVAGETAYVGKSRVTFDTLFPEMGGYVRTKLLVEMHRKSMGFQVFVTNPTNAFSDTFAFGNQFNPTQARQITPQRPTTLGVTLFAAY